MGLRNRAGAGRSDASERHHRLPEPRRQARMPLETSGESSGVGRPAAREMRPSWRTFDAAREGARVKHGPVRDAMQRPGSVQRERARGSCLGINAAHTDQCRQDDTVEKPLADAQAATAASTSRPSIQRSARRWCVKIATMRRSAAAPPAGAPPSLSSYGREGCRGVGVCLAEVRGGGPAGASSRATTATGTASPTLTSCTSVTLDAEELGWLWVGASSSSLKVMMETVRRLLAEVVMIHEVERFPARVRPLSPNAQLLDRDNFGLMHVLSGWSHSQCRVCGN